MVRFKLLAAIILAYSGSLWAATPALTVANTAAYTEEATPTILDGSATLTDGNANFGNGFIRVQYITAIAGTPTAGAATDQLSIEASGNVTVVANDILYSGMIIGSFTTTGANGANLFIQLTTNGNTVRDNIRDVVRCVAYRTTSQDPASQKFVRFTVSDDTTASNDEDVTINITGVNDAPTLAATGGTPTFTEGGAATDLFSSVSVSTVESGQNIVQLVLTVTNVTDTEELSVDGFTVALTNGNSVTTTTNTLNVAVAVATNTATVTITKTGNYSAAVAQTVVDGLTYRNTSDDPATANRVVSLTSIQDNGGTANGGADTSNPGVSATVTVVAVNDAPTLTATGASPTFTEGGAVVDLFSAVTVSAVEAGQDIIHLVLTVSNVTNGASEELNVDGSTVALTNGNTVTGTTTNGLDVAVAVAANTATVTVTNAGNFSTAIAQSVVDGLTYRNTDQDPSTANRVVSLTSIRDTGGTANSGADTSNPGVSSTVTVQAVNDAPTFTATGLSPTYNENAAAATLYSTAAISTIEASQTIVQLVTTVTNVTDGAAERLTVDGSTVQLTNGFTVGSTATNAMSVSVAVSSGTATVTISKGAGITPAAAQTLVNALAYFNTSNDPTAANRVVTLTSIQDSGGTANGGVDTTTVSIASTVTVVAINDAPTLTATASNPTFTEGGTAADLFSSVNLSTVEAGQNIIQLVFTVTNVNDGASEQISVDGSSVQLTNGFTVASTTNNTLAVSVSVVTTTATVTVTKTGNYSAAIAQALVDGLSYTNSSQNPNTTSRVVTVTSLQDTGGTANGGVDTSNPAIASTVTVVAVNDPPSVTNVNNPTFDEVTLRTAQILDSDVTVTDDGHAANFGGGSLSVDYNGAAGSSREDLGVATVGSISTAVSGPNVRVTFTGDPFHFATYSNNGGGSGKGGNALTIALHAASGSTSAATVAKVEALLEAITYASTVSSPPATRTLDFVLNDNGGTANGGDQDTAFSIVVTISAVNDAPIVTVTTPSQSTNEDTQLFLGGSPIFTVDDPEAAGADLLDLVITATNGTVLLKNNVGSGITAGQITNNGTATVTVTNATEAQINATLADAQGIQFSPTLNFNGTATVTVTADDNGISGSGGAQTGNAAVTITVNAVNDQPVRTTPTGSLNVTVLEGFGSTSLGLTTAAFSPGGGTDENGQTLTYTITAIPSATVGTVRITAPVAADVTTTPLVVTLQELRSLVFNENNTDANGSGTLTFTIVDNGGTALGGVDTLTENLLITVTPVNDKPTVTQPLDPVAVNEDPGPVSVQLISAIATPIAFDAGPADEDGSQTLLRYNLVSVTSSGNIAFTALPAIDNSGVLTYTLASNTNGTAVVTFNAQDNGGTANSGVDTSDNRSFTITVNAVNDAPVNTVPGAQTVLEDAANVALSSPISVSDVDIAESAATFGVTVATSTGTLTATASGTATVTGSGTALLTIASGNATDTNAVLNSIRYTAVPGASGTPASVITVTTTDNGGTGLVTAQTDIDTININITAVNDAPIVTSAGAAATYTENAPLAVSTLINAVTVTDEDSADFSGGTATIAITANGETTDVLEIVPGNGVTVTGANVFVGGNQVGTFANGTGGVPLTLSLTTAFATPANIEDVLQQVGFRSTSQRPSGATRTITFTVVDGDGTANGGADTDSATGTVNVIPINDAPAITLAAVNTYTENGTPGALVGVATLTDPDSDDFAGGSLTLSITNINEAGDVLELGTDGTVTVAGVMVSVSGTAIGDVAGGTAGAPLTFTNFTTNTTPARLLQVLQRIRFRSTSERPPETARNVRILVNDGDGTANGGVDAFSIDQSVAVDEVNDVVAITSSNKTPIFTFDTTGAVNTIANVALPGQNITFTIDAKDSDDPITFLWDFGDGTTDPGTTVSNNVLLNDGSVVNFSGNVVTNSVTHNFTKAGVYTVRVSAKDGRGADDPSNTIQIIVNSPPREKPNNGGAQPPLDSGLIALTDFLKLTQPQTYTVILAGLTANTDEDGDPLVYTFDLGDGTTTTVSSNTVDTSYPLLPQTAVLQENGLSSIIVKVTVTDVPQTPGVPAGTLQLTRQIFFTEPIVGAAVDDIDVFNPNQGLTALGINSQGNRGAVIQFDVVNAKSPVLNVIPLGQETGELKDFFSPAKKDITGLAVLNSPAGTFRFFVQFKKPGLYLAQITDTDGRIVRKMIPVTVPDITGAQRELQDFNVSSSFITGKLNFTGGKADQLKFRARFPLVNNSLYTFDKTKEFELVVGIGNIAVTLNVPPTGNAKIMAIRDALGNVRQPAKGTQVRFKPPKSTNAADGVKNPSRIQAIVDFRLALEDIDLAGLDSEGVTQEHGTVTDGEVVLNTGGLLGGSTLSDSKIDVGDTGVQVNTVQATLKKNNLVPIGIQTIFLIDRQLAYASKIPAGFVAKKNNGQLAGKK